MAGYQAPILDMQFLLSHLINAQELWPQLGLHDADCDTAKAILDEAAKLCEQVIAPLNREADEQGCQLVDGKVIVPAGFNAAYKAYCEGGWGALGGEPAYEGMGMPKSLVACVEEMLQGANMAFGLAPMLTAGACLAISAHGSDALKQLYLPKMYSGEWAGAMDLTEPHAGTDLGLMRTKAVPNKTYDPLAENPDWKAIESFSITGTKIFITWGEHDMASNIVHLVLAKLPNAPAGAKGISLFLVPKYIPNNDGTLGVRNHLSCGALEKKMGIKASATCVMNFDGAKGWLVGEPHKGLAAMFTMMNYERLTVGIQAVAAAEASYQNARNYAKDRLQSRSPSGVVQPQSEADPIIVHPDVRRMLLHMRAFNEAGRAFYLYVAKYLDIAKYSQDKKVQTAAHGRVALLTPVAKAFMSDMALSAAIEGQQVLGGHGFIREWGQEQYVRDIRITQIYEGTNGIQALDLLGRKVVANSGVWLNAFLDEVIAEAGCELAVPLKTFGVQLTEQAKVVVTLADEMIRKAKQDPNAIGDSATDFLHLLGLVTYAYLWLKMADEAIKLQTKKPQNNTTLKSCESAKIEKTSHVNQQAQSNSSIFNADFLQAKVHVCQYFFNRELPKVSVFVKRIQAHSNDVMGMADSLF